MNYYLDTEFIEGPQDIYQWGMKTDHWLRLFACFFFCLGAFVIWCFISHWAVWTVYWTCMLIAAFLFSLTMSKTPPTIDLISIGLVADDNREYYAISKDFNLREAWNRYQIEETGKLDLPGINRSTQKVYWIRENVLRPIWIDLLAKYLAEPKKGIEIKLVYVDTKVTYSEFNLHSVKSLIQIYGKSNKKIANEIKEFVYKTSEIHNPDAIAFWESVKYMFPVNFYAHFGDYDWVRFCWLFGKMNDLPKGFPYYCRDLQQIKDEKQEAMVAKTYNVFGTNGIFTDIEDHPNYPIQDPTKAHNAIEDARWSRQLHEFLKTL